MNNLWTTEFTCTAGPLLAAANDAGIALLEFADTPRAEAQKLRVCRRLKVQAQAGQHPYLNALMTQINAYCCGERIVFDLPLQLAGTSFQQAVWQAVYAIPYGTTRTYSQVAAQLNRPTAARAVGMANGANPLAILIPCHRLLGANGSLTGYGGGLARKEWLLALEKLHARKGL